MLHLRPMLLASFHLLAAAAVAQLPPGPPVQQAYLKGSHAGQTLIFGTSVALSGDTLLVGAPTQTAPVPGPPGSATVFVRGPSGWAEQAWLTAPSPVAGMNFGYAVGLSGDTAVIGAPDDKVAGVTAGSAHVFVRSGGTWTEQAVLTASNPDQDDLFGWDVGISGDTIVVGAWGEDGPSTGVNGAQGNGVSSSGAAYVFVRNGTTWSQQAYLKASNADVGDQFGWNVGISGDTIVAGAHYEASAATGVNGNQADNSKVKAGAAYVFTRSGTTWSQQAYLKASNPDAFDTFSDPVAIDGDTIAACSSAESSGAAGVDGNQADNSVASTGAVYVFTRSGTTWTQQAYLKSSNPAKEDFFGFHLAVSGDLLLAGAGGEDSAAGGVGGNQADNSVIGSGAAYLFERHGASWSQVDYMKASYSTKTASFGRAVAISGSLCAIGAPFEKGLSTGINGDQTVLDNTVGGFEGRGAAYAFDLDPGPWTNLTFGFAGAAGVPTLTGIGALTAGSANDLVLSGAAPSAASVIIVGLTPLAKFFKQGVCVPFPDLLVPHPTDAQGGWALGFKWPAGVAAGTPFYLQCWIADAGAPAGFAASNALEGVAH